MKCGSKVLESDKTRKPKSSLNSRFTKIFWQYCHFFSVKIRFLAKNGNSTEIFWQYCHFFSIEDKLLFLNKENLRFGKAM